jgi:hypothetical protein
VPRPGPVQGTILTQVFVLLFGDDEEPDIGFEFKHYSQRARRSSSG